MLTNLPTSRCFDVSVTEGHHNRMRFTACVGSCLPCSGHYIRSRSTYGLPTHICHLRSPHLSLRTRRAYLQICPRFTQANMVFLLMVLYAISIFLPRFSPAKLCYTRRLFRSASPPLLDVTKKAAAFVGKNKDIRSFHQST